MRKKRKTQLLSYAVMTSLLVGQLSINSVGKANVKQNDLQSKTNSIETVAMSPIPPSTTNEPYIEVREEKIQRNKTTISEYHNSYISISNTGKLTITDTTTDYSTIQASDFLPENYRETVQEIDFNGITSLMPEAFKDCTSLECVTLPNDYKLSASEFEGCSSLQSVTGTFLNGILPEKVFKNTPKLREIEGEILIIEKEALYNTFNEFNLSNAFADFTIHMTNVTSIGDYGCAFSFNGLNHKINDSSIDTISSKINFEYCTTIGKNAFEESFQLLGSTATFDFGITSIPQNAFSKSFSNADNVTFNFPNVTSIGINSFYKFGNSIWGYGSLNNVVYSVPHSGDDSNDYQTSFISNHSSAVNHYLFSNQIKLSFPELVNGNSNVFNKALTHSHNCTIDLPKLSANTDKMFYQAFQSSSSAIIKLDTLTEIGESMFENAFEDAKIIGPSGSAKTTNLVSKTSSDSIWNHINAPFVTIIHTKGLSSNDDGVGLSFDGLSNITQIEDYGLYGRFLKGINISNITDIDDYGMSKTDGWNMPTTFTNCISLGDYAFAESTIQDAYVSQFDNATTVGTYVFQKCRELNTINISNNDLFITNEGTFADSSVKDITYNTTTIKDIGKKTFYNTDKLVDFTFPVLDNAVIGESAFEKSKIEEVVMTSQTNTLAIQQKAFKDCNALTNVNLNFADKKATLTIGNEAFKNTTSLTTVDFNIGTNGTTMAESSTVNIGNDAFMNSGITGELKITTKGNVILGKNAFKNCSHLTKFDSSEQTLGQLMLNDDVFTDSGLTTFQGPTVSSTALLLGNAFRHCLYLESFKTDNISSIIGFTGPEIASGGTLTPVFKDDSKLKTVEIGTWRIPFVTPGMFENCINLESISLTGVMTISDKAFYNCHKLNKANINFMPITTIGSKAFYDCGFTGSIDISTINRIYDDSFENTLDKNGYFIIKPTLTIVETSNDNPETIKGRYGIVINVTSTEMNSSYAIQKTNFNKFPYVFTKDEFFKDAEVESTTSITPITSIDTLKSHLKVSGINSDSTKVETTNYDITNIIYDGVTKEMNFNVEIPVKSITFTSVSNIRKNGAGIFNILKKSSHYVAENSIQEIESINITPDNLHMMVDEKQNVTYSIMPDSVFEKNVWWTSSDSNVAKVTQKGIIIAKNEGKATITCYYRRNMEVKGICEVTVGSGIKTIDTNSGEPAVIDTPTVEEVSLHTFANNSDALTKTNELETLKQDSVNKTYYTYLGKFKHQKKYDFSDYFNCLEVINQSNMRYWITDTNNIPISDNLIQIDSGYAYYAKITLIKHNNGITELPNAIVIHATNGELQYEKTYLIEKENYTTPITPDPSVYDNAKFTQMIENNGLSEDHPYAISDKTFVLTLWDTNLSTTIKNVKAVLLDYEPYDDKESIFDSMSISFKLSNQESELKCTLIDNFDKTKSYATHYKLHYSIDGIEKYQDLYVTTGSREPTEVEFYDYLEKLKQKGQITGYDIPQRYPYTYLAETRYEEPKIIYADNDSIIDFNPDNIFGWYQYPELVTSYTPNPFKLSIFAESAISYQDFLDLYPPVGDYADSIIYDSKLTYTYTTSNGSLSVNGYQVDIGKHTIHCMILPTSAKPANALSNDLSVHSCYDCDIYHYENNHLLIKKKMEDYFSNTPGWKNALTNDYEYDMSYLNHFVKGNVKIVEYEEGITTTPYSAWSLYSSGTDILDKIILPSTITEIGEYFTNYSGTVKQIECRSNQITELKAHTFTGNIYNMDLSILDGKIQTIKTNAFVSLNKKVPANAQNIILPKFNHLLNIENNFVNECYLPNTDFDMSENENPLNLLQGICFGGSFLHNIKISDCPNISKLSVMSVICNQLDLSNCPKLQFFNQHDSSASSSALNNCSFSDGYLAYVGANKIILPETVSIFGYKAFDQCIIKEMDTNHIKFFGKNAFWNNDYDTYEEMSNSYCNTDKSLYDSVVTLKELDLSNAEYIASDFWVNSTRHGCPKIILPTNLKRLPTNIYGLSSNTIQREVMNDYYPNISSSYLRDWHNFISEIHIDEDFVGFGDYKKLTEDDINRLLDGTFWTNSLYYDASSLTTTSINALFNASWMNTIYTSEEIDDMYALPNNENNCNFHGNTFPITIIGKDIPELANIYTQSKLGSNANPAIYTENEYITNISVTLSDVYHLGNNNTLSSEEFEELSKDDMKNCLVVTVTYYDGSEQVLANNDYDLSYYYDADDMKVVFDVTVWNMPTKYPLYDSSNTNQLTKDDILNRAKWSSEYRYRNIAKTKQLAIEGVEFSDYIYAVNGLTLDKHTVNVIGAEDESNDFNLVAKLSPNVVDIDTIIWESTDESVATVTQTGHVNVKKVGTATIKATALDGGHYDICTLHVEEKINSITIQGANRIVVGNSSDYTTTIDATGIIDDSVTWSISGNTSSFTKVKSDGKVIIGPDESASNITLKAVSNFDNDVFATKNIDIIQYISGVTVNGANRIVYGSETTYSANIDGSLYADKSVTWNLDGNQSINTTIDSTGKLKIALDETADIITITATSVFDTTKSGTKTIIVDKISGIDITGNEIIKPNDITSYDADVITTNEEVNKDITWSIEGNNDTNTVIDENGQLTVGADEDTNNIVIKATSVLKPDIAGIKNVMVKQYISNLSISGNDKVYRNDEGSYESNIDGSNKVDKSVTWTITGNQSTNTTISEDGILKCALDETSDVITVIATSVFDNTYSASKKVEVLSHEVETPIPTEIPVSTVKPTITPTMEPTITPVSTANPTVEPTIEPIIAPTIVPTPIATPVVTSIPTTIPKNTQAPMNKPDDNIHNITPSTTPSIEPEKKAVETMMPTNTPEVPYENLFGTKDDPDIIPNTIELNIPTIQMKKNMGIKQKFQIKLLNQKGAKIKVASTKPKVATVNKKGVVTTKKKGKTKIIINITKGAYRTQYIVNIKVKKKVPFNYSLVKYKTKYKNVSVCLYKLLRKGSSYKIKMKHLGKKAKISFKSSNPKIVSVNKKGKCKSHKVGKSIITITAYKGNRKFVYFMVIRATKKGIESNTSYLKIIK